MEPDRNSEYGKLEYWQSRYEKEQRPTYEWFIDCKTAEQLIAPYIGGNILDVGCVNSDLSFKLAQYPHVNCVIGIDFSETAIQRANSKLQEMDDGGKLKFQVEDVTNMSGELALNYFDLVIDKGTLDALVAEDSSPLFPSQQVIDRLDLALINISTRLKPNGKFISITLGQPHFRVEFYKKRMVVEQIKDLGFDYFYLMSTKQD